MSRGHRLLKLENGGSFVYMRHAKMRGASPGSFLLPSGWRYSEAPRGFTDETADAYGAAATGIVTAPTRERQTSVRYRTDIGRRTIP